MVILSTTCIALSYDWGASLKSAYGTTSPIAIAVLPPPLSLKFIVWVAAGVANFKNVTADCFASPCVVVILSVRLLPADDERL